MKAQKWYLHISLLAAALLLALFVKVGSSRACVGRTIYIGYYPSEQEQVIMSRILTVFIDERTGTTVKLVKLKSRDEAYDLLRRNRVSILVDYAGNLLKAYGRKTGEELPLSDFPEVKGKVARALGAVIVGAPGFDSAVSGRGENLGRAVILLSRKMLSRFPAMPRLLRKLRGTLPNESLVRLLEEGGDKAEKVARSFLKKRKLI